MRGLFAAVTLLMLSGCTEWTREYGPAPPACEFPDDDATHDGVSRHEGPSRFRLLNDNLTLVPGSNLTIRVEFRNEDGRTFCLLSPCYGYDLTAIRVGSGSLLIHDLNRSPHPAPAVQTCAPMYRYFEVLPGETRVANLTWDGAFRVTQPGHSYTLGWAAPGRWPVSVGYVLAASHAVHVETSLWVVENDLNRNSTLHPDRCGDRQDLGKGC